MNTVRRDLQLHRCWVVQLIWVFSCFKIKYKQGGWSPEVKDLNFEVPKTSLPFKLLYCTYRWTAYQCLCLTFRLWISYGLEFRHKRSLLYNPYGSFVCLSIITTKIYCSSARAGLKGEVIELWSDSFLWSCSRRIRWSVWLVQISGRQADETSSG